MINSTVMSAYIKKYFSCISQNNLIGLYGAGKLYFDDFGYHVFTNNAEEGYDQFSVVFRNNLTESIINLLCVNNIDVNNMTEEFFRDNILNKYVVISVNKPEDEDEYINHDNYYSLDNIRGMPFSDELYSIYHRLEEDNISLFNHYEVVQVLINNYRYFIVNLSKDVLPYNRNRDEKYTTPFILCKQIYLLKSIDVGVFDNKPICNDEKIIPMYIECCSCHSIHYKIEDKYYVRKRFSKYDTKTQSTKFDDVKSDLEINSNGIGRCVICGAHEMQITKVHRRLKLKTILTRKSPEYIVKHIYNEMEKVFEELLEKTFLINQQLSLHLDEENMPEFYMNPDAIELAREVRAPWPTFKREKYNNKKYNSIITAHRT